MTKFQLMQCLFGKLTDSLVTITDSSGVSHTGWVSSIEREDGSGHSFNVTMHSYRGEIGKRGIDVTRTTETVYIRTTD